MKGIEGIEIKGHQADRGKGGGDLACNNATLAHAGDHKLALAVGTALQQL